MIAGQNPEAVFPFVVDDVVYVADRASGECVSHVPMSATISRCVDVDFVTLRIVEVFSPENIVAGYGSKMQGTGATKQFMRHAKFCVSRAQSDDRARNG